MAVNTNLIEHFIRYINHDERCFRLYIGLLYIENYRFPEMTWVFSLNAQ